MHTKSPPHVDREDEQGDDDVAVAGRVLRPDEDEVAVGDVSLDHRVATDLEDVRIA